MREAIFNYDEIRAIGLSIFNYSLLAQPTETGRRSLPLTGLAELSTELRLLVLDVLSRTPVTDILTLSSYTPTLFENTPLVSFRDAISPVAV